MLQHLSKKEKKEKLRDRFQFTLSLTTQPTCSQVNKTIYNMMFGILFCSKLKMESPINGDIRTK